MDTIQADGREEVFVEEGLPLSIPDPPLWTYKCHNLTNSALLSWADSNFFEVRITEKLVGRDLCRSTVQLSA